MVFGYPNPDDDEEDDDLPDVFRRELDLDDEALAGLEANELASPTPAHDLFEQLDDVPGLTDPDEDEAEAGGLPRWVLVVVSVLLILALLLTIAWPLLVYGPPEATPATPTPTFPRDLYTA